MPLPVSDFPPHSWPVIGHDWAVQHLGRAIRHQRGRHAYLFTGPHQIGKTTLARALAATLNCTGTQPPCGECRACTLIAKNAHPDVAVIEAEQEGGTLKIKQVRELQQTLILRPYEAHYRVVILRRFHEANTMAQDALLKTLEEPTPRTVLILTATTTEYLRPTIISRCQPLQLRPLAIERVQAALADDSAVPPETAYLLAHLSGGRIGWAIQALHTADHLEQRQAALDTLETIVSSNRRERFEQAEILAKYNVALPVILEQWQTYWRDILMIATSSQVPITNTDRRATLEELALLIGAEGAHKALLATRKTAHYLKKNVNTRLALEVLMLDYHTGAFQTA